MIYQVLPGDSLVEDFNKTNIEGEIVVCRECLIEGDLDAKNLEDFWSIREAYLTDGYSKNENFYAENVKSEFEKLLSLSPDNEINLWFEYELFCQANMWFCLSLLSEKKAEIYRVAPVVRNENDLWKGFGGLSAEELERCFEQRTRLSSDDVQFGKQLWRDFCFRDNQSLKKTSSKENEKFPHLTKVCEAAAEIETRPKEKVRELIENGETDFRKLFQKFSETEGVYGFGHLQVKKIYEDLTAQN